MEGPQRGQGSIGQLGGGHELQGVGARGGQGLCGGQQHREARQRVAQNTLHCLGPSLSRACYRRCQEVVEESNDLRRHRVGYVTADESPHRVRSVEESFGVWRSINK